MYRLLPFLDEVADIDWIEGESGGLRAWVIILITVVVIAAIVLITRAITKKKKG